MLNIYGLGFGSTKTLIRIKCLGKMMDSIPIYLRVPHVYFIIFA